MDYLLLVDACALEGYVNPVAGGGRSTLLHDELVELQVVHHPKEPFATSGFIWDVYVNGFTCLVLAVGNSTDGFVQGR